MSWISVIGRHRTKLLGGLQVCAGAVTTQLPQFQATLKPVHYGLIMMIIGTTTALLGFVNSQITEAIAKIDPSPPAPPPPPTPG